MIDLKSFAQSLQQIADEKGIPRDKILEAIEMAISAAYKRDYGKRGQIIRAHLDSASGKVAVKQIKIVVDESMIKSEEEIKAEEEERVQRIQAQEEAGAPPRRFKTAEFEDESLDEENRKVRFNPEKHLMLEDALKTNSDAKPGDELEFLLEAHDDYGRIAAQTAKQVVMQRLREMEREAVFDAYKEKEGEIVSGIIQRMEGRAVFIDIGRAAGILPPEEQIAYERYRIGDRIKALIVLVEKNPRGPGVFLSRTHPRLLRKLFEIEVPEIASGAVEIKAIAREPGSRTKIAVFSHEPSIDPVGSLVGQKGIRVSTVIQELGGEKIDVIEWSESPEEFIAHSFSPAKVLEVELLERKKEARVIVPHDQLSLAIGKGGQNVRLAARLTGWRLDVRSDKQGEDETGVKAEPLVVSQAEPEEGSGKNVSLELQPDDAIKEEQNQPPEVEPGDKKFKKGKEEGEKK